MSELEYEHYSMLNYSKVLIINEYCKILKHMHLYIHCLLWPLSYNIFTEISFKKWVEYVIISTIANTAKHLKMNILMSKQ